MTDHPHPSPLDAAVLTLRVAEPAPPDEVLAARRLLNAAIAQEHRRADVPRRRWLAAAVTGAAAVVVALVVVFSVTSLRAPTAQALLFDLIDVAIGAEPLDPAEGEFTYVRAAGVQLVSAEVSIDADRDTVAWLQPFEDERWYAADGSFRVRFVPGERQFFSEDDAAIVAADPFLSQDELTPIVEDLPPRPVDVLRADLPTEAGVLREALIDEFQLDAPERTRPLEVELVDQVGDLMVEHDATPQLRAALLGVLADLDGIELVERGAGRFTVGVEYAALSTGERLRLEYVFDQDSALLVEEGLVYLEPAPESGIPAGTTSSVRYDAPEVVAELGG